MTDSQYDDWRQVAGYFDGDGSSDFKIGKRVVFVRFHMVDNYRPQLEAVKSFLNGQGIRTETMHGITGDTPKLGIGQGEGEEDASLHLQEARGIASHSRLFR